MLPRAHGRGVMELDCGGRHGAQRSRHDQLSTQPPDAAGDTINALHVWHLFIVLGPMCSATHYKRRVRYSKGDPVCACSGTSGVILLYMQQEHPKGV